MSPAALETILTYNPEDTVPILTSLVIEMVKNIL